ncbi:hypothetical protein CCO02nite_15240 [Cellulomonas composti]|uniref:Uncharacterized protein n=1 Tax=Cellulomonas composti TaxID=266130 RepID=A0A511JA42_9CELL|nr:hypothetical protein CCO02nite_15240 [Cellulomonas composti]
MTIDLSSSTEPRIAVASHVIAEVQAAIASPGTALMVIGATARDILSVGVTGEPPSRATADVDIAIAVPSWAAYAPWRRVSTGSDAVSTPIASRASP